MAFLIDSNSSNGTDSDTVTSYHVHGCYALSAKVTPGPDQKLYLEAHCEPTTSTQGEVESHNATYSSEIDSAGLHDIMLKSSCVRPIGVMLRMILDALRSSCCLKTGQSSEKKIVQVGVFNVSELHEAATAAQSPLQYFLKERNRDIMPSRSHRGNVISQNDNLFFVLDYNEQYSCATYYIPLRLQVQKSITKPREECVVDQETSYLNQCGNQSSEPSLETTSDISPHVQPSVASPARLPSDTTMSADEVLIPYAKYTQLERELDGYRRRLQTSEAQNVTLKRTLEKELVRFERMQSCDVDLHRKTNYTEMAQTGLPFASSTSSGTPMDGSARLSMKDDKREVKDASQIISIPARERADEEEQIRALLIHAQELEKENAKLREEVVKWKRRAERNLTRSSVVSTHEQRPSVHARSYASHRASPPVRRTLVSSRPQTPSDRSRHPSVEDRGSRNGSNGRFTNQRHQAPGSVATGRGTPSTSRNLQSAVHSPSMRTASRVRRSPTMPRATASEQSTLWRRSPSPCSVMGTPPTMPQRRTVRVQDEIRSTRKPPECSVRIRATPPDRSISRQRRESGHFQSRSPQCEFRKGAAGRLHSSRGTPLYNRNEAHPSTVVRSSRTRGPRYSLLEEDEIGDRLSWGSGEDADADSWCGSRSVNSVMECGSDEWSMFETSRVAHRHVTSTRRREYSANALDQSSTIRGATNETRTRYRSPSFPLPPFR